MKSNRAISGVKQSDFSQSLCKTERLLYPIERFQARRTGHAQSTDADKDFEEQNDERGYPSTGARYC